MYKQYIATILFLAAVCLANAQQPLLFSGNVPSQTAVELKWMGGKFKMDDSYDVYRRETGGSWQKINTAPIKRATPLGEAEMKKEAEKPGHDDALLIYSGAFQKGDEGESDPAFNYFVLNIVAATQNDVARYMGQYFVDKNVTTGKSYEYRVTLAGKSAEDVIAASSVTVGAYTQPAAPAGFTAEAKDKRVLFKWAPDKKFAQYKIFRSTTPNGTPEATLTPLLSEEQVKDANAGKYFYEDKDSTLVNGKTYYYKICGVDFFGHDSKISNEVSATPADMTGPRKINGFKANIKGRNVLLSWWRSKDADCTGYNVYKSKEEKSGFVKQNSSLIAKSDTTYSDTQTKEGEKYYYYMEAVDAKGNATKSDVASYVIPDMTPPSVPKGLVARVDTGKIYLSWEKNSESDLAGYYLFRALKNESSNFQLLNSQPLKGTTYLDTLPKEAGNYFLYRISAVDKSYNRSAQSDYIAAKMPDVVAPAAVTLLTADLKDGKLKLEWSANHERDLKGYEVWRAETDTGMSAVNGRVVSTVNGKTLSYTDERVSTDKRVLYYIVCVDSAGNRSPRSNTRLVAADASPVEGNGAKELKGSYDAAAKTINLSWQKAVGGVDGYKVYRREGDENFVPVSALGQGTSFIDKPAGTGTYEYKILTLSPSGRTFYSAPVKVEVK